MQKHHHGRALRLYRAVCALGNNRVAHALCSHVDQAQLLHEKNDVVPTSSQDEALARYSVSREVPCSILK